MARLDASRSVSANLQPESRPVRANISWGVRQTNIPRFPEQMSIQQGTINPGVAISQGATGVMMPARMVPVDVVQVTYCSRWPCAGDWS